MAPQRRRHPSETGKHHFSAQRLPLSVPWGLGVILDLLARHVNQWIPSLTLSTDRSYYYPDAQGPQGTPKSPIWPEMAGLSMVHHARYCASCTSACTAE